MKGREILNRAALTNGERVYLETPGYSGIGEVGRPYIYAATNGPRGFCADLRSPLVKIYEWKEDVKMNQSTYTLSQVIQTLKVSSDLEFETELSGRKYIAKNFKGDLCILTEGMNDCLVPATTIPLELSWVIKVEPKEPVNFLDGVLAALKGKRVYKMNGREKEYMNIRYRDAIVFSVNDVQDEWFIED
jgi:hypothetical protein